MGRFSKDVSNWSKKTEERFERLRRAIVLELFSSIILDTPVGNPEGWENPNAAPEGYAGGRLRGNWKVSSGSPDYEKIEVIDPEGKKTVRNVKTLLKKTKKGKDASVFLTNNLPYAYRVEYEGWSDQAPEGMVRKNFIRVSQNLKRRFSKS